MVQVLYIISIVCLVALLGAVAAIVHHVRVSRRERSPEPPPEPTFADHFNAAAEYGSSRTARAVAQQSVQSITAKKDLTAAALDADSSSARHKSPHIVHRSVPASERASRTGTVPSLRVVAGTRASISKRF